jgi:hypothetical protein
VKVRFLLIIMALFASAHFVPVHAQDPPPPPPARDYFPKTWDEYSFPAGKFRIRLPQKPVESTSTNQSGLTVNSVDYKGLIAYRVSYVDYPGPIDNPDKVKGMLQGLKTAALNSLRDKEVRIVSEREIDVDGHPGLFLHIEVAGKEVIRLQWVLAGSRFYTVSATSRKGSREELEGENDFEKAALGFISSFHVLP